MLKAKVLKEAKGDILPLGKFPVLTVVCVAAIVKPVAIDKSVAQDLHSAVKKCGGLGSR